MTEFTIVQIGDEFAVAADDRLVIKFGSAELAVELVQTLAGHGAAVPLAIAKSHEPSNSPIAVNPTKPIIETRYRSQPSVERATFAIIGSLV